MALTKRQKEVLDFIQNFVNEHGYSPSYEELANGLNLASLATVHKHVSTLESKDYLRRSYNQSRSLEVTSRYLDDQRRMQRDPPGIPLAGRIAAGVPVETFESNEKLQFSDFTGDDTFALQVRGESMIDDHICDGDYVLVERTASVRDGDIAVALVNGAETTLKRFYREADGMVRLQPANAAMEPIRVAQSDVQVQGRLLAVLRKYK
ncbi:MAG: transcriptional repressor LexA [Bryobacteraceae bacterium]